MKQYTLRKYYTRLAVIGTILLVLMVVNTFITLMTRSLPEATGDLIAIVVALINAIISLAIIGIMAKDIGMQRKSKREKEDERDLQLLGKASEAAISWTVFIAIMFGVVVSLIWHDETISVSMLFYAMAAIGFLPQTLRSWIYLHYVREEESECAE